MLRLHHIKTKTLKSKEGNNPVHIDPVQNHYRKLVSLYRFMESLLKQMSKKGNCMKIFGSDEEDI